MAPSKARRSPAVSIVTGKESTRNSPFPIVGVGASAGGIEAFSDLLQALPEAPGFAIVYILHQEAKHVSMLPAVFERVAKMPVQLITDGMVVEPNHIYIVPPASDVTIDAGVLLVTSHSAAPVLPVDTFFRSLAEDQGSRAAGVILSGNASDGALGARAIKAEGGLVFAQDDSAKYSGMPSSAAAAGGVDFILDPAAIAEELVSFARAVPSPTEAASLAPVDLEKLFSVLRASHDIDFTYYKPSTVERRVRRRMAVNGVETLRQYLKVIEERPEEIGALYADLLIRVTGFFRDPSVFEALQRDVYPALVNESRDEPVRVWVPGCATGEEVYSIAISLLEVASKSGFSCPVQIFGTDVSNAAIEYARAGFYPDNIDGDVSPERLRSYFGRADGRYRVNKAVRDCCIFARQDLIKDPPFSKLDLVSCRNVMIYLGAVLQRRVMSVFHYALRPEGFLLLGSSETIGSFGDLFEVVDRKHKIYKRKGGAHATNLDFRARSKEATDQVPTRERDEAPQAPSPVREADRILLSRFAPAGVLINDDYEILQFRGRTSGFLEPAPGVASFNLLKMLREGLLADVRGAIQRARKTAEPVRREDIVVHNGTDGGARFDLEVLPLFGVAPERYFLVVLQPSAEVPAKRGAQRGKVTAKEAMQSVRLKKELKATRDYLQSIIEEQEAMNEELRSANEEIQSSNEELQSTNEELETAKEELQSTNEELITLNEELENRNQELAILSSDLLNLLTSIEIPVVMLDGKLRLRRVNPVAQRTLNLTAGDIGRPLSELKTPLDVKGLQSVVTEVIEKLELKELSVMDVHGKNYVLRIRPYRTTDNKIDGAVLVLLERGSAPVNA